MTPRELAIYADAYADRIESEQEQARQAMYTQAMLTAQFTWAKGRRPSYEEVFKKKTSDDMSDDELLRQITALNAMFGGSDKRTVVN